MSRAFASAVLVLLYAGLLVFATAGDWVETWAARGKSAAVGRMTRRAWCWFHMKPLPCAACAKEGR